jgi:shikimate dehydrogenase
MQPDRYAVIGNPIAHSRSPEIHTAFARTQGHDIRYEKILAPVDGFVATLTGLRLAGVCGANVTLPFKTEAYELATELTPRARAAGAANTLKFLGEKIIADNTDGVGLTRDILHNLQCTIAGKRVLLIGAGGAARGVVGALLDQAPSQLRITNRTFDKVRVLIADWAQNAPNASPDKDFAGIALSDLASHQFDIVINATSASINAELPAVPPTCFAKGALAYDMMYGGADTPFMTFAKHSGVRAHDGLGMLVEQAAEAYLFWRGVRPDTKAVLQELRTKISTAESERRT